MRTIASGTYNLGELADVLVASSESAHVTVTVAGSAVLDETLFANADGQVVIGSFGDMIKPYMTPGEVANAIVKVDNVIFTLKVEYCLLSLPDTVPVTSVAPIEGVKPVRCFVARLADGALHDVRLYGFETEKLKSEREVASVYDVETVVYSSYSVEHEIKTTRLTKREVLLLTGLAASSEVWLAEYAADGSVAKGAKVNIAFDANIYRTVNDPTAERTASLVWTYADKQLSEHEYDDYPARAEGMQNGLKTGVLHTFVFGSHTLRIWGTEEQVREYDGDVVITTGTTQLVRRTYRVAHKVKTSRMSRTELRALAMMTIAHNVTCDGKAVIIDDKANIEISTDPESNRTAEFTWRYADKRTRTNNYE